MIKWLPVWIGLLAGALSVLPYIYATSLVESNSGQKFSYFYQDSELVYLARIREVTEGNFKIASPVFLEYKQASNVQQPFGEWVYAIAAFGNPNWVPEAVMVLKFVLPAVLYVILYFIVFEIIRSITQRERITQAVSFLVPLFVVLGYDFINIGFVRQVLTNTFNEPMLSLWTRTVYPILGAIGLFAVSYVVLTLGRRHTPLRVILGGLALGFTAGYIFSFAVGLTMMIIMSCFALLARNWERVKNICAIITIALMVNSGYIISIVSARSDISSLQKNGLLLTHHVLHNKVLYIAAGVFLLATLLVHFVQKPKEAIWKQVSWQWLVSASLAGFICLNEQVITGKTVWPGHFVQYTNPIGYIIFCTSIAMILCALIEKTGEHTKKFLEKMIVGLCVTGILGVSIITLSTIPSVRTNQEAYVDSQRYRPVIDWLNTNAHAGCVVFVVESVERLEKYIPAYTACDLYHSSYVFSVVPNKRVMHNYIVHLRLLGITEENVSVYLDAHEVDMREYFFADWADKFSNGHDTWVFNTRIKESMDAFLPNAKARVLDEFMRVKEVSTDTLLRQYAITYIVVDTTHETQIFDREQYPNVFEKEGIQVREVK
jgi:hypothetical protein